MPIKTYKKRKTEVNGKIVDAQGKVWSKQAYQNMRDYQTKYNANKYRMYNIRFFREEDADIIAKLNDMDSVNNYIRTVVREDMKKKGLID